MQEALQETKDFDNIAVYHDMGLGKTFTGSEMMKRFGCKVNLIVCQKSKVQDWVEHFADNYQMQVFDLTNKKQLGEYHGLSQGQRFFIVGVINYELAWRRKELLDLYDFTLMLDESSLIQNQKAKQTKFILKMKPAHVILLSGTPVGGKYENLWTQVHLLGWKISEDLYNRQYVNWTTIDSGGLDSLRVIRQTGRSKSELFNLSKFRNSIKGIKVTNIEEESQFLLENFFDWFFEIGYSELIFADRVILYEGDSERLYIRKLIKLPEFSALADSYIAFIQVGGAYAHNYLPILKMLKMKTLIITDLDYNKDAMSMEEVKREDSKSTNATINYCYRLVHADREKDYSPTIKELYDFQVKGESVLYNGLVYLTFQDEKSTARTLEEAMLNKLLKVDVFHAIKRSEWKEKRKINNLTFSIPNNKENEEDSEYSIHRIVEATSNNKTDFMYSVILSGNEKKMLPDYIEKGLLWLAK